MTELILYTLVAVALLALLLWLVRRQQRARLPDALPAPEALEPLHCRYFPQIRQALAQDDERFIRERASPQLRRQWRRERRRVLASYLRGLREDQQRMMRLARLLARMAPAADRAGELERLRLALRFERLYAAVWLRLALGWRPERGLELLATHLGSFSEDLTRSLAALAAAPSAPGGSSE
jgi:hypothetical protein